MINSATTLKPDKSHSVNKQKYIVDVLDNLFQKTDTVSENIRKNIINNKGIFECYRDSIFKDHVESWSDALMQEICVIDWGNTNLTKSAYAPEGKFLAVSAAGCDGRIDHFEHRGYTPVLSAIGAQCGKMFFPEEEFTAIKNTITLTPKPGKCIGKFLYYLLNFIQLPKRGAGQPFISKGDIQKFPIKCPSLAEQKYIVEKLDRMHQETKRLEETYRKKLFLLKELKQAILRKAFAGELTERSAASMLETAE